MIRTNEHGHVEPWMWPSTLLMPPSILCFVSAWQVHERAPLAAVALVIAGIVLVAILIRVWPRNGSDKPNE